MRRLIHAVVFALVFAGLVVGGVPAQAATKPGVTVSKSSVATPAYGASTTIKPKFKKGPRTKVTSAKVTVRGTTRAGGSISKIGTSVRVPAGKYKVTTKVTYKVKATKKSKKWSGTKTKSKSYSHTIGQGAKNCATMADYNAIVVGTDDAFGSFKPEVEALMAQIGASEGPVTLEDMYWLFYSQGDRETADYVAHLQDVYGENASVESVDYRMCASTSRVSILYVNYLRYDDVLVDEVIYKEII